MYKLTTISNNNALSEFKEEHGFALLLEGNNSSILFDTGFGIAFRENAKQLNIDLSSIDSLILSHGHYDHCGNIDYILKNSPTINIYHHPLITIERYSIHKNRDPMVRMIGLTPENKTAITKRKTFPVSKPYKIDEDLFLTGEIPRLTTEDTGGPFFLNSKGDEIDTIPDDQAIWIENKDGLIIITGCCHSGLINTVEYIKKVSDSDKVQIIIGGLHLAKASEHRVKETIDYINNLGLKTIYPGHCTGDHIIKRFRKELNCSVEDILAGKKIVI